MTAHNFVIVASTPPSMRSQADQFIVDCLIGERLEILTKEITSGTRPPRRLVTAAFAVAQAASCQQLKRLARSRKGLILALSAVSEQVEGRQGARCEVFSRMWMPSRNARRYHRGRAGKSEQFSR